MASGSIDSPVLQEFRNALGTRDPKTVATYLTTVRDFMTWLATQPGGAPFRKAHSRHPPQRTRVLFWGAFATSSTRSDGSTDRSVLDETSLGA